MSSIRNSRKSKMSCIGHYYNNSMIVDWQVGGYQWLVYFHIARQMT